MKRAFTLLAAAILSAILWAQGPEKISYQSVIRNSSGNLVANQEVGVQISILQGSASGTTVYAETQTPTTNANGLISIEIGDGNLVSGDFSLINWASGTYFIKTETDPDGGSDYSISGTSQLLSVPYALYAKKAETITGTITETDPEFGSSPVAGITGADITGWNNKLDSFTETDPVFDLSLAAEITGEDTTNWNHKLDSFIENDPVYGLSVAAGISEGDTTRWSNKLDTEVDGSITNEIQALSISNDTIYLSKGGFVKIPEQKSIPALITQDDFSCTALKSYWTLSVTGGAGIGYKWNNMDAISLSTSGANTIKLRSNRQKSVTEGKLIFTAVTYTYEDNNIAYGPLVRGLVNGTDRNNAIEFINISGNTIQARTVSGGAATTTNYAVGASVGDLYSYTIIASNKKVEFYFNGTLIATHTTTIPIAPLNMYFDASTWGGNVPQCIDDAKFEIIRY